MTVPTDGNDDSSFTDHPDLSRIAGEMRAEWREEQASATADAAAQLRHSRGLTDWLRDRMHAGDRVGVVLAGKTFTGLVEEVGDDLLGLRCGSDLVEIHVCASVPISFELVEHATKGGTRGAYGRNFRDALLNRDGRAGMRVGTRQDPDGIDGTLLLGADFVSVAGSAGVETIVPIAQISWVSPIPR